MSSFLRCLFGPKLLRLNLNQALVTDYEPVLAEQWGDTVLTSVFNIFTCRKNNMLVADILCSSYYLVHKSFGPPRSDEAGVGCDVT